MIIIQYRWKCICEKGYGVGCYKLMYHIVPKVQFSIYITLGLQRCREVGFIQRLYIISTAVRLGLPDGLLLSLLLRHLSMMRVVRWGILRFMMSIWYGTLLNSE